MTFMYSWAKVVGGVTIALCSTVLSHGGAAAPESAEEPPSRPPWQRPSAPQPVFLNDTERHVVSPVGVPAYLRCMVQHPGDKTVSWVRKRDLHILTVGMFTYTTDKRFLALHSDGTQEWTLKILAPTVRDSGVYECHVSTEPKISMSFQLDVVVSRARILGNAELLVQSGSDVNLTCDISHGSSPVYWYHGGRVLNYQKQDRFRLTTQSTLSRLYISHVTPQDSGNYTCSPAGAESASATLHVIDGEHPAAMQHNSASLGRPVRWPLLPLPLVTSLLLLPPLLPR